jgi:stage II sporulation protein D
VRRTSLAALVCLTASACLTAPPRPRFPAADFAIPRSIRVQVVERGAPEIREVGLEEYVHATVLSEFAPPTGDTAIVGRMLEVQAVISRTYAAAHVSRHAREGFDLCATTHCQLFDPARLQTSRWSEAAALAVDRTAGVVLRFRGAPAQALFHADCGGRTSTASAVWGGDDRAYLLAHADDGIPDETHARWEYRVAIDALGRALDADDRTKARGEVNRIEIVRRDASGRAQDVSIERVTAGTRRAAAPIERTTIHGDDLRQVLSRTFGPRAIRSTLLDVRRDGRSFVFTGRGFGHGVGLCQAGALARVRSGSSLAEIVQFYYPGTTLESGRAH